MAIAIATTIAVAVVMAMAMSVAMTVAVLALIVVRRGWRRPPLPASTSNGINITTSGQASTRIDMERRGLALINRLGVHYYNSEEEVDRFIEAIAGIARA